MTQNLQSNLLKTGELTRRQFAAQTARALLGVGLLPGIFSSKASAITEAAPAIPGAGRAKNVIYLFMSGGQSQFETWNPKEGVESAGPTTAIKTSVDGIRIAEHLPLTARQMQHIAIINSLTSTQGAHEHAKYFMHTSYALRGTIRHPGMGAWVGVLQGGGNPSLPNYVYVGDDSRHPGAGFLPPQHSPLFVNDPEGGLKNVTLQKGVMESKFVERMNLANELDKDFRSTFQQRNVQAYAQMYDDAIKLMKSEDLKAFDLAAEPEKLRNAYGLDSFGQGCLLARRLVERGVRFVEVSLSGWDTHNANFVKVPELCQSLDRALASLLADLHTRGLLEETLVVVASEFGRTPDINSNMGRDHFPLAFSAVMAGGGIKGGIIYGKTDKEGREIEDDEVTVPDFNATIAAALGLPLDKQIFSPSMRPFTVADKGKPVAQLFA